MTMPPTDAMLKTLARKCCTKQVIAVVRDDDGQHVTAYGRDDLELREALTIAHMILNTLDRVDGMTEKRETG